MSNHGTTRQLATAFLIAGGALLPLPLAAQVAETGRDPYSACVAAETARQTGGVTAEARARQKCRKLYPSGNTASPTLPGRADAIPVVAPATPATTPAAPSTTPTAAASPPVASPMPAPTVPAGGHPHGGPPGLNK